jgi:hypothetical protein
LQAEQSFVAAFDGQNQKLVFILKTGQALRKMDDILIRIINLTEQSGMQLQKKPPYLC